MSHSVCYCIHVMSTPITGAAFAQALSNMTMGEPDLPALYCQVSNILPPHFLLMFLKHLILHTLGIDDWENRICVLRS